MGGGRQNCISQRQKKSKYGPNQKVYGVYRRISSTTALDIHIFTNVFFLVNTIFIILYLRVYYVILILIVSFINI